MIILGIETSCDETASAVCKNGEIISSVVSQQIIHAEYGGVVPELASREHEILLNKVVHQALNQANINLPELDGIAVTQGPGLNGTLLTGICFAKGLGLGLGIPVVPVNHLEGHIFANFIADPSLKFPFICLLVSGGHTQLWYVKTIENYKLLGETRDDAAGEAFDKGARILGLGYPGANRSHFKSIALWETGGDGEKGVGRTGWLTDDINGMKGADAVDAHGISLDGGMGVFASPDGTWISMTSIRKFVTLEHHSTEKVETNNPALSLLLDRSNSLNTAMDSISKKLRNKDKNFHVKGDELGRQFELALNCISAGVDTPVIKVSHGGFDTHENQKWSHGRLLRDLSRSIFDTRKHLIDMGEWDNTLIMTYSEFGRRAYENKSEGTDHGTAAPHFLIGGKINGGFYGEQPSLSQLKDGDMEFTTDYRSIYNTVLESGFSISHNKFSSFKIPGLQKILV